MKTAADILSRLITEQRVAAAAYRAVDCGPETGPAGALLRRIERDHSWAARVIERASSELLSETDDSDAWRAWAQAVRAGAHHLGTAETLDALRLGEEHVRQDLERSLAKEEVPFELRDLIGSRLLPATVDRIAELDRIRQRI